MKQIIKRIIGLGLLLCLSVSLIACSPSGNSSIEVQEGVEFKILDALKINNKTSNTVYYYFLASVENKSDKVYHMSNLNYRMASHDGNQNNSINAIDRMQTVITNDVNPEQSTFVYGFIDLLIQTRRTQGYTFLIRMYFYHLILLKSERLMMKTSPIQIRQNSLSMKTTILNLMSMRAI